MGAGWCRQLGPSHGELQIKRTPDDWDLTVRRREGRDPNLVGSQIEGGACHIATLSNQAASQCFVGLPLLVTQGAVSLSMGQDRTGLLDLLILSRSGRRGQ